MYVAGGTATLTNSTFSGNTASGGNGGSGGMGADRGGLGSGGGNGGSGGNGGAGMGGGVYVAGGTVTLTGVTLNGNNASGGHGRQRRIRRHGRRRECRTFIGGDFYGGVGGPGGGGAPVVSVRGAACTWRGAP